MDGGAVAGIVVGVIVLLVLLVLINSIFIVHQAEGLVIERLGKFDRLAKPGINFMTPLIEAPRSFTWRKTYIDVNGRVVDSTINSSRIDLRESVFNFLRQEVYTSDTILVDVNSLMYYSIEDIKKAIYEVDDLQSAISNVAQTQLKDVFGRMSFTDALQSQAAINAHMMRNFKATFAKWGIKVERIELQDLSPRGNISVAMKKQMIAERTRRGEFIRAEGNKAAMTITSEGTKMVKFNMGVAEQEATRKRSEGDRDAKITLARAESSALDTIAEAIQADNCSQTDYMIAQRYMELFRAMVTDIDTKVIYLPYEVTAMTGVISHLPSVYGRGRPRAARTATAAAPSDAFAALN